MRSKKIEEYKKRLEKERADLVAKLSGEKPEDFGSDVDPDEEADEAESFGEKLAIDQALKERIEEIDIALSKIKNGTYGICENCAKEISDEILKISPESSICKNCKKNF